MESVNVVLWPLPVKTVSWEVPLGEASAEKAVEPWYASSRLLPEETAENLDALTPLPQESLPLETPQSPLEEVMVKLLVVPVKA